MSADLDRCREVHGLENGYVLPCDECRADILTMKYDALRDSIIALTARGNSDQLTIEYEGEFRSVVLVSTLRSLVAASLNKDDCSGHLGECPTPEQLDKRSKEND